MKTAIQQPYFYPYIGYFNLIKSVDQFVFFTDVQYTRRGWINRNRLAKDLYITVPVQKTKQKENINNMKISYSTNWHYKHCKTLECRYGKKCLNHPIYLFYKNIPNYKLLAELLLASVKNVCDFLEIKTKFIDSKDLQIEKEFRKKERIIKICKKLKTTNYHNLPGGNSLYSECDFLKDGIELKFVEKEVTNYMSIFDLCLGEGLEKI